MSSESPFEPKLPGLPIPVPDRFRTKDQIVYEELRHWILTGQLAPGDPVDQERIAAALSVSRMPLRQALLRLEADGLITAWPHRTATVAPLSLAELQELYDLRLALEPMLAEAGSPRLEKDDLAEMARLLTRMEAANASGDLDQFVELDWRFHHRVYAASGYRWGLEVVTRLRDASDRYVYQFAAHDQGATHSCHEHRAILDACLTGPPETVRRLTNEHLLGRRVALIETVKGQVPE
jgi:DNA-binding GntR family transcriptional regulator